MKTPLFQEKYWWLKKYHLLGKKMTFYGSLAGAEKGVFISAPTPAKKYGSGRLRNTELKSSYIC